MWSENKNALLNSKIQELIEIGANYMAENAGFGVHSTEAKLWFPTVSLGADGYLVIMITGHRPTGDKLPGINWDNVHKDIDPRTKARTWTWRSTVVLTKFIIWLAKDCGYKKIRVLSGAAAGIDLCWARAGVNAMLVFRQAGQYAANPAKMTPFFATAAVDPQYVGDITTAGKYADDGVDIQLCMAIPCKDHQSKMKNEVLQLWRACCNIAGVYGYYDKEMAEAPYRGNGVGRPVIGSMEYRNRWMVEYARKSGGFGFAIWNGSNGGTGNCIKDMKNAGLPGFFIDPAGVTLEALKERFESIKDRVNPVSAPAPVPEAPAPADGDYPVAEEGIEVVYDYCFEEDEYYPEPLFEESLD